MSLECNFCDLEVEPIVDLVRFLTDEPEDGLDFRLS